jgi:hypothetical protein
VSILRLDLGNSQEVIAEGGYLGIKFDPSVLKRLLKRVFIWIYAGMEIVCFSILYNVVPVSLQGTGVCTLRRVAGCKVFTTCNR